MYENTSPKLSSTSSYIVIFSLFWLVFANVTGLVLSILLAYPELNNFIEPLTYGRLIPLHLNFHLYGWSSMPLIGLLYYWFLDSKVLSSHKTKLPLLFWSIALLIGGFAWTYGITSGKIFLEWKSIAEYSFLAALLCLWGFLVKNSFKNINTFKKVILISFGSIPIIFKLVLDPKVFPPINLQSSGATGASLMISTLGIILIYLITPYVLSIREVSKKRSYIVLSIFLLHFIFWLSINHAHSTQYDYDQILGLSSLSIWLPLLHLYYKNFEWPSELKTWLISFGAWTAILFPSAAFMFLPGNLELVKFSSLIVAHVHIAMAGMTTSFCMLLLLILTLGYKYNHPLLSKFSFYTWQIGLILHLTALVIIGENEINHSGLYVPSTDIYNLPYILRIISGILMTLASVNWLLLSTGKNDH